jgi:hypothetical protein
MSFSNSSLDAVYIIEATVHAPSLEDLLDQLRCAYTNTKNMRGCPMTVAEVLYLGTGDIQITQPRE